MNNKHDHDDEEIESDLSKLIDIEDDVILRKAGVYYIYGPINEGSLQSIHRNVLLKHLAGPANWNSDLVFIINSPGGLIDETNGLLDLLSNIRMDIRTVGLGTCASAGAQLLAAGTKGKRLIGESTQVMIHCYSWGSQGKHHELVASRHAQDHLYDQEVKFWIKHSKYKTKKDVEKYLLKKEDVWLTAKEALKHGIVDHIGDVLR
jgi:ATP-dependent Clp protease protease subunit